MCEVIERDLIEDKVGHFEEVNEIGDTWPVSCQIFTLGLFKLRLKKGDSLHHIALC